MGRRTTVFWRKQRFLLALVGRAGPLPAGTEPPAAARCFWRVRVILSALLRPVRSVRPAAAALRPEVRVALVARIPVCHRCRRGPAGAQQVGRRTAHLSRSGGVPVRPRGDPLRGAEPSQHRADGAWSRAAGRSHRWVRGVADTRRERWDEAGWRHGGLRHQKDRDRKNLTDLKQSVNRLITYMTKMNPAHGLSEADVCAKGASLHGSVHEQVQWFS